MARKGKRRIFTERFVFLWFTVPWLCVLIAETVPVLRGVISGNLASEDVINLEGAIFTLVISTLFAIFIVRALPRTHISPEGIEVLYYHLPFYSRWILLRWEDIEEVRAFIWPVDKVIKEINIRPLNFLIRRLSMRVFSRRLPLFYSFSSLIYGLTIRRSVVVSSPTQDETLLVKQFLSPEKLNM